MRSLIVMGMFAATLCDAAWNGYTEVRDLEVDAGDIKALRIDAGAGTLVVKGDADVGTIAVEATINVPGKKREKAQEFIASNLQLSLEKNDGRAVLTAFFDSTLWGWGDSPSVDVVVVMPSSLALDIDDSSGSLKVMDVAADVVIDDSSGSLSIARVGSIAIDDGSGSIDIVGVDGDVRIDDGSGSIKVRQVSGSVTIDDGSGSIEVDDVEHDLTIVDDGSGSFSATDVRGTITPDT